MRNYRLRLYCLTLFSLLGVNDSLLLIPHPRRNQVHPHICYIQIITYVRLYVKLLAGGYLVKQGYIPFFIPPYVENPLLGRIFYIYWYFSLECCFILLSASFAAMVCLLSYSFLPLATAISTLTFPSFK